ncbi:spastin [Uncinocarpus reesii 1704]|uniref:Spastin n=1 Tax=Uncinocarpus reesii (strain UAMH 1704) TaxID=336963 RepID=C4JSK4_UNCRE|nr:spastin [Uncinocarpus reesii 1704]EEP80601.1 spastin [Uncinocarpus reesii 1704]
MPFRNPEYHVPGAPSLETAALNHESAVNPRASPPLHAQAICGYDELCGHTARDIDDPLGFPPSRRQSGHKRRRPFGTGATRTIDPPPRNDEIPPPIAKEERSVQKAKGKKVHRVLSVAFADVWIEGLDCTFRPAVPFVPFFIADEFTQNRPSVFRWRHLESSQYRHVMMLRPSPGTLMQKTYDDCYLTCSTAVYFESKNNEEEALRSWRDALETICRHNASVSSSYVPQNETERALQKSIQELELQCKERIDLLEALRESRRTAGLETGLNALELGGRYDTGGHNANAGSNSGIFANTGWIGDGTIPSLGYPDLPRPSLPPRIQPRDTNQGHSTSTLPTISRTTSSEKKKTLLPTLRGSKDKKSSPENRSGSLHISRPAASKAADLAWNSSHARPSAPTMTHTSPASEFASRKWAESSPRSESHSKKPSVSAVDFASGAAAAATRRPTNVESTAENLNASQTWDRNLDTKDSPYAKRSPMSKSAAPAAAYPTYRKEYPESRHTPASVPTTQDKKTMSASQRHVHSPRTSPKQPRTPGRGPPSNPTSSKKRSEQACRPSATGSGDRSERPNIKDRRSSSGRGLATHLEKDQSRPSSRMSGAGIQPVADDEEDPFVEDMEEDDGLGDILNNLPKGVDRDAAGQILNEIVVRGDEVHWDDIAGLEIAKKALKEAVVYPFLRPDLFMGLREPTRGMLLFGPPGTGKTMLARAVATESKSTFFSISATSLTSKWHGESEKLVRTLFALAKAMAPSIIFVDEIDSLLASRASGDHDATRRSKTQFLIEWSDLQRAAAGREQTNKENPKGDATRVLVLGATNMPWDIDEAARRRFARRQYIPLPEDDVRKLQIQKLLSHQQHDLSEEEFDILVKATDGFSGSDITALAKDAAMGPLRKLGEALLDTSMDEICPIRFRDFEASLDSIRPSVSRERLSLYENWAQDFGERGS